jgi:hypothetical protein
MHSNDEGMAGESVSSEHAARGAKAATGMEAVEALTDAEVLSGTRRLVCQSNRALAALLAHLAEVEARGLHRTRACSSLYTYCIYELRMSEDAAYRRVAAARVVKRFPVLLGAIERGELHLTALLMLAQHVTETNVGEVIARAQFRTKKEIEKLVRLLSPLPDVPSRIEPLGLDRPRQRPTWGNLLAARHPVRELPQDERPDNWLPPSNDRGSARDATEDDAPARNAGFASDGARTSEVTSAVLEVDATASELAPSPSPTHAGRIEEAATDLSGPQRYKVQFTASEEYIALVEEAKALLAHSLPNTDLAEINLRAVRTLVAELKKRKYAISIRRGGMTSPLDISTNDDGSVNGADESTPLPRQRDSSPPPAQREAPESPRQRGASPCSRSRHVPAAVRRAVFERDGNRCTYVDERGVRCHETQRLELHHHEPFARGGAMTTDNLSLYCAAHNALAAEEDFGREFSVLKRKSQAHFTERTLARATPAVDGSS